MFRKVGFVNDNFTIMTMAAICTAILCFDTLIHNHLIRILTQQSFYAIATIIIFIQQSFSVTNIDTAIIFAFDLFTWDSICRW